jgi:ent-kaurene oxidase
MAKVISTRLQPYSEMALEAMHPQVAQNAELVLGKKLNRASVLITLLLAWILVRFVSSLLFKKKKIPPSIPGLPLLGNLLQLTEKKPHRSFTTWAAKYGPIFSIQVGSVKQVVITSPEIAKEAMITKYEAISSRKMPLALQILTRDKTMVAMSDYGDEHRMLKKLAVVHLLNSNTQKQNRPIRETDLFNMLDAMFVDLKNTGPQSGGSVIDVRDYIKRDLFPFSMFQVWGYMPEEVDCPELGVVTKWEIFEALVISPMKTVIEVDWRDFFPACKWLPNKSVEENIKAVERRRTLIIKGLIKEQRRRLKNQPEGPGRCYADILLTQATHLSDVQLEQSLWEPIIESTDTILVTTEWIMFELASNPAIQERLYKEVVDVTGGHGYETIRMVTEDDIPCMPYLSAVIKETLRKYPPVPLLPSRYVEKDTTLGGYDIPKGWQVLINIFGINNDPNVWPNPEKWDPERVLNNESLDMGIKNLSIMPFGAGKRLCAGITQAMFLITMNVASFVQHFKWELAPKETESFNSKMEDVVYLTTHKLHPLQCIITPRVSQRLP